MRILPQSSILATVFMLGILPMGAAATETSYEGTIIEANVDTFSPRLTLTKSDGTRAKIFLDSRTAVTVDGRSARVSDLKVGQQVQATGTASRYTGQLEATVVTATLAPPPPAAAAPAAEASVSSVSTPATPAPTGPRVLKSFSSSEKPAQGENATTP